MKKSDIFIPGKIYTYSNFLSISRLPIAIGFYFFTISQNYFMAFLMALLGMITDIGDGYLARKRNEVSELGKILDPIADKFSIGIAAIALYQAGLFPLWLSLLIIGRDVLILIGSLLLMNKVDSVISSEIPGKVAVIVISFLIIVYLFDIAFLKIPFIVLTIGFVFYSFVFYLMKYIRLSREGKL